MHRIILIIFIVTLTVRGFYFYSMFTDKRMTENYENNIKEETEKKIAIIKDIIWENNKTDKIERPKLEKIQKNIKIAGHIETIQQARPHISPEDFKELAKINPDIVAWIWIPGTNIDYPVVKSHDNETYLYKDFEGNCSPTGSIFLDFESQSDLRGQNNILYGHHMKNGSMFKDIVKFKEESYFKEHQYFEIDTPQEAIYLKAISCYYIQNDPSLRQTRFRDEESFQQFVQEMINPCEYAKLPISPVKGLYTLVTCSYEVEDGRTVLFAVEV